MKYLESLFKHTWRPQQVYRMDPSSRFESAKTAEMHVAGGETEMGEVKVIVPTSSVAMSATSPQTSAVPCKNGGCRTWRNRGNEPRFESPWHSLKTIFLVSVIVALLLWQRGDRLSDSQSVQVDTVGLDIVVENKPQSENTDIVQSTSARETQMRQYQSAQILQEDQETDDSFPIAANETRASRVILIGWDNFRSKLMLFLIVCLVIWACIFFPLLDTRTITRK